MTRALRRIRRDNKGVGAVEFALLLPLLILLIVGIAQMGILYFAHAGLRNLVAEGARFASISPRPTDAAIKTRINQGGFGLTPSRLGQPVITYGNTGGNEWADIEVSYTVHLDFVFWRPAPFPIQETRRVFLYPAT
ncbi:MAG TPA: TadE/TadG family type IV pilus assembly protein [Allosphingosinicella sp.]|jgi:Flp pilus assembly pilin Flp